MTQRQYIINRKLNIVELGTTLGNISEACRKLDISRKADCQRKCCSGQISRGRIKLPFMEE